MGDPVCLKDWGKEPSSVDRAEPSRRLTFLLEMMKGSRARVLSLDVFDTLLYRSLEKPADVFLEMHCVLQERFDAPLPFTPVQFAQLRTTAEATARRGHPSGEVTLEEIAGELSRVLDGILTPENIIEAEVVTEERFIRLDHDMASLILHSVDRGIPYILVSDMYLGPEQILTLFRNSLQKAGIVLPDPLHVFVSGAHRTGKGGDLFETVCRELNIPAQEILHVGDNPHSDVEAAARHGITGVLYERESAYVTEVLARELVYLQHSLPEFVTLSHNDLGLSTLRAKALASEQHDLPLDHFGYGAFVLGPILTLFAGWVVDDCLLRNQKSPYCLMREGNFLASLINLVASHRGVTVEARPLWASRYALRSASIVRADEPELRGYFNKRRPPALRTVARDLGLSIARLRALAHIDHDEPLAPGECDRLIQALLQDTPARQRIRDATSERRSRLLAYYERAGLFDQDQVTIVDLGWAGSLQEGLNGLLREKSRFSHLRGLYFGTNAQILKKQGGCSSFDSFLFHLGSPIKPFGILSRTPEIIEQSCMCEEGSFFGLCEKGEPLTFPLIIPAKQVEETSQMQRGVRHFASLWLKGNHDTGAGMNHSGRESVLARLRATLVRSLDDPVLEEVHLFRDWVHDDNDGSLLTEPLLGNEQTRRRAQDMTPSGIREFLWLECFWPAGLTRLLESEREQRTNARMCPEPSQGGFI